MVLNAAARLVVGIGNYAHITPVLHDVLYWLPVPQKIKFKIATLTFDCVRDTGPSYTTLTACTVADHSGRPGLHSTEHGDLFVPRTRTQARKTELLHRSSSCLELTAASPSLPVHQSQSVSSRAQDSSFQAVAYH